MGITPNPEKLRVLIAGGGVAALESALALAHIAPELTDVTLIAPNPEFIYRPMTVREPFGYGRARRYPLQRSASDAGAKLLADELSYIDPDTHTIHTKAGQAIEYDALVLALGARACPRYSHALTIDDRRMDETLHGLIQDIEGGYIHSLAFVAPGRMAWPLPLYELAMMTAGRAYDIGIELSTTIVTPEDSPLVIFGSGASDAVDRRARRRIGDIRAVSPRDTRDVADRREAAVPHRPHHRRSRVQLGDHRHTHLVTPEQDRRPLPRSIPRRARQTERGEQQNHQQRASCARRSRSSGRADPHRRGQYVSDPPLRTGSSCLILGYDRTASARLAAAWAARQRR